MNVQDIMTLRPACCAPDVRLSDVARTMQERDCGEIPVCDAAGRPIGVVTDRDIVCRVVARGMNPTDVSAKDCMSHPVITTTPDMPVEDCVRLMEQYKVRRLPVVDGNGTCCGMVAQADLARKAPRDTTMEMVETVSAGAGPH